jgi:hypothetical protein
MKYRITITKMLIAVVQPATRGVAYADGSALIEFPAKQKPTTKLAVGFALNQKLRQQSSVFARGQSAPRLFHL